MLIYSKNFPILATLRKIYGPFLKPKHSKHVFFCEKEPEERKRRKGKYEKRGEPYFPLLPFLPSGQFSEESVAKKVKVIWRHKLLHILTKIRSN
jgi:hypothetical protein